MISTRFSHRVFHFYVNVNLISVFFINTVNVPSFSGFNWNKTRSCFTTNFAALLLALPFSFLSQVMKLSQHHYLISLFVRYSSFYLIILHLQSSNRLMHQLQLYLCIIALKFRKITSLNSSCSFAILQVSVSQPSMLASFALASSFCLIPFALYLLNI